MGGMGSPKPNCVSAAKGRKDFAVSRDAWRGGGGRGGASRPDYKGSRKSFLAASFPSAWLSTGEILPAPFDKLRASSLLRNAALRRAQDKATKARFPPRPEGTQREEGSKRARLEGSGGVPFFHFETASSLSSEAAGNDRICGGRSLPRSACRKDISARFFRSARAAAFGPPKPEFCSCPGYRRPRSPTPE